MTSDCSDFSGPLSPCGTRIGLTLIVQSASLSVIAVVSLLIYISYLTFKNRHRTQRWHPFRSHLDLYLLGLLLSDLIDAIGAMMEIKWIEMASVREGGFCTAQGVLLQFGDVGVALCSSAIAIHTFFELVLRWKEPASFTIPIVVLSLYVTFLILIIVIGHSIHDGYYGNTTYWCWITPNYLNEEIGLEYVYHWITALINLVLYIPIFLALKGIIVVEPSETWARYRMRLTTRSERQVYSADKDMIKPQRMLFYPAVYIVTVLPIALARIPSLINPAHETPFPSIVVSGILFWASGIFNVIVYTSTRPAILHPSTGADAPPEQKPHLFWGENGQPETDAQSVNVSERPNSHLAGTSESRAPHAI